MPERLFGHAPGYPEGSTFNSRTELSRARVHMPIQAGITGSEREGAESIVLSGGYEDDVDYGDEVVYTGHGGRDPHTGRQIHDQPFSRGNRALALSKQNGLPVRVIRGGGTDLLTPRALATGTTGCTRWRATGASAADQGFWSGGFGW